MLPPAEIYTEHKYFRLILKVHSPKELAGFINEPAEVFLSYIPVIYQLRHILLNFAVEKVEKDIEE